MSSKVERKLAAIMFTDIAGYTEQMSKNEAKTLDLLEKKRSILNPLLKKYKGTFVKEMGDGTLTYFDSAINAASCAVKLQETTYDDKDMNIRAGIHIGDIVFKDGDVFGGGVNVASRLESIAPAGGICVSKSVYDELSNQDNFDGIELGLQSLKGVGRLIEVFGLKGEKLNEPNPDNYLDCLCANCNCNQVPCCCDEMPSIAIIPFRNKGREEDAFYAYGICSDLVSDISSAGLIKVASLEEIEELGDISFKEKAKKLFVRYVATGTLWKMNEMFQLSLELFDIKNSNVLWSDRWQENWENLPSIKENLVDDLLKAVNSKHKLEKKVETTNTEAYEFYLKAKQKYEKRETTDDTEIAQGLLNKAIELDDNLLVAKIYLGKTYAHMADYITAMDIFNAALNQAKKLDNKPAIVDSYWNIGGAYTEIGNYKKALKYENYALELATEIGQINKVGFIHQYIGIIYHYMGDYDKSFDSYSHFLTKSEEIGDKYGRLHALYNIGSVYRDKGEFNKAVDYYNRSKDYFNASFNRAYICFTQGNHEKVIEYLDSYVQHLGKIKLNMGHDYLHGQTLMYLAYKKLGKDYDVKKLLELIKQSENIYFWLNYDIYKLIEDVCYLELAYNEVQEKADNLEPNVTAKFLNCPIPKAIIEEYNKVFQNIN